MNKYLSLYAPRFVSILGYMLQTVEYDTRQFLRWFWLQQDFSLLNAKRIKPTPKSRLLVLAGSLIYLGLLTLVVWLWYLWLDETQLPLLVLAAGVTALLPIALTHLVAIVSLLGSWTIQKPLEILRRNKIVRAFDEHPGNVIVIAGSYGKTSMKHLLEAVLSVKLKVAATPGNYNTPAGIARFIKTTDGDEDILIIEAGEYRPGDITHICGLVGPDIGFITGVNEQHLWHMKSIDNALKTVFELADALPGKSPLYINAESEYLSGHITKSDLAYSREGVGKFKISKLVTSLDGTEFTLKPGGGKGFEVKTSLLGMHHAGPIAAAAHLADSLGLSTADIKKGLNQVEAHSRRFKPQEIDGVMVIDDSYNGNPDGFLAGIEFLKSLKAKRKVYATPGMIELGRLSAAAHFAVGQHLAESKIEHIILNRNPATEQIAAGLKDKKFKGEITWLKEQEVFMEQISQLTKKGDVVLMQNSPRERFFYL